MKSELITLDTAIQKIYSHLLRPTIEKIALHVSNFPKVITSFNFYGNLQEQLLKLWRFKFNIPL
jgi:hypothetical protein